MKFTYPRLDFVRGDCGAKNQKSTPDLDRPNRADTGLALEQNPGDSGHMDRRSFLAAANFAAPVPFIPPNASPLFGSWPPFNALEGTGARTWPGPNTRNRVPTPLRPRSRYAHRARSRVRRDRVASIVVPPPRRTPAHRTPGDHACDPRSQRRSLARRITPQPIPDFLSRRPPTLPAGKVRRPGPRDPRARGRFDSQNLRSYRLFTFLALNILAIHASRPDHEHHISDPGPFP